MAVALFIKTGRFERHLRRMNRLYAQKYEIFKNSLVKYELDAFDWIDTTAGLHVFGSWKYSKEEYFQFQEECAVQGVAWEDADYYYSLPSTQAKVILGFSHLSEDEIEVGVKTMSDVFKKQFMN